MAKGPKPNQYNRYKRPEHNSGRARTAFNTLKMCAVSLVAIWGAEQGFEKWLDQKADKNSPAAPDVTIPVEVPWNTQGIKPYPDAPSGGEKTTVKKEEKKTPSLADGVIWEENGSKNVRPSTPDILVAKNENTDPVFQESLAAAAAELERRALAKKPFITQKEKSGTTLPTVEIVDDKIAQPPKAVKPPEEWVPIESLMKAVKPTPTPEKTDKPVIKQPVRENATDKKAEKPVEQRIIIAASTVRATSVSYGGLPKLAEVLKDGSQIYTVGPRKVVLTEEVAKAIYEVTALFHKFKKGATLPPELLIATCAREGNCNPKAINETTKACGLFQFMPELTLPRVAYTYGPVYGYSQTRELITQTVRNADAVKRHKAKPIYDYHVNNNAARKELAKLCLNPRFNAAMFIADKHYEVKNYETWLKGDEPVGRDAAMGEVVALNNLGINYTKPFAMRAWQDKANGTVTSARGFFNQLDPAIAVGNPSLVKEPDIYITLPNGKRHKHATGKELSVQESWNKIISEYGGWQSTHLVPSREL